MVPPDNKFKHGKCERHGAVAKLMLMKVIHELAIVDEQELRYAVGMVFQAKNRLARRTGFSPLQVVLGHDTTRPHGSVDQVLTGRVQVVANHEAEFNTEVARMARIRAAAHEAFLWLDAHTALRSALNARPRPTRSRAQPPMLSQAPAPPRPAPPFTPPPSTW